MGRGRGEAVWSDLPNDLLQNVADNLHTKADVTRLRSVCKSWRLSLLPFQNSVIFPLKVPYLGLNHQPELPLFLTQSTLYYLSPSPGSISSNSTSWGWLIKVKESQQRGQLHLINPLSPLQIQPLPDSFPKVIHSLQFRVFELANSYTLHFSNLDHCNYKVALSPNPECPSIMIAASGVLWHLKLGQDRWTAIDDMISQLSYEDVIHYQGKFCAVDELGKTVVIDSLSLKMTEIASSTPEMACSDKNLVESNGELLLVNTCLRIKKDNVAWSFKLPNFKVFKLKVDQNRWVQIKSLDNQILFLGHDCSFSVSARNFVGCKGNCILCNDPCFLVFNLDNNRILRLDQHPEYASIFYPPTPWPSPAFSNIHRRTWHDAGPSHSGKPAAKKQKGLA